MKTAIGWKDYQVIATGGGQKLERWGDVVLLRPDPQAIWAPAFDFSKYTGLHATYERSQSGGGAWKVLRQFPDEWNISYKNLKFIISPTGFKHTGLFPEQAVNWDRIASLLTTLSLRDTPPSRRGIFCSEFNAPTLLFLTALGGVLGR